jgi:glycosyltransferase involved in cell wall biosynthesis
MGRDVSAGPGAPGAPIVSVAIPTRNYGRYLPRALTSALQAGALLGVPFEIVVVDDASTDETRELLERFRLAHPNQIKVVYRTTTRGVAVAKNTAFGHCSGRYIALLDADDEFHPEKLVRCYAQIAGGGGDLVTHDYIHARSPTEQILYNTETWAGGAIDFWPPSTWVFPNGGVRYNEQMIGGSEDLEWLARHRRTLRRRHVAATLNIQHEHSSHIGGTRDSVVPACQVIGRMQGRPHAYDHRAPNIWTCDTCGRQLLLPTTCCGRVAQPRPLLFYSVVESPSLPSAAPEFSFVFLTRNREELTRRAVESLVARMGAGSPASGPAARLELIFVDGSSTDGTLAAIQGWAASLPVKLVMVPPEEPFNYSRNANRGARAATGDSLLLTNNDVEIRSDGLPEALRAALSDPRVGVVGVSTIWHPAHRDPEWDTGHSAYVFTERPMMGHLWGARRDVYWELGGLDEAFTGYGYEELDFEYRALLAHYRLALATGDVYHHGAATFRAVHGTARLRALEEVNRALFERKHGRKIYCHGDRIVPFAGHDLPAVSVVMVARNAGAALRRTLEAAAIDPRCHDGSTQLVVVDNGSQDDTALVLAEYRRSLPRLLSVIDLLQPVETHRALAMGQARAIGRVVVTRSPGEPVHAPLLLPGPSATAEEAPAPLGTWELLPESTEILAVHAALLHTGKVLYFAGSENDEERNLRRDVDSTRLWDPVARTVERLPSASYDVFCGGHAFLGDGRLLVGGGIELYDIGRGVSQTHSHEVLHRPSGPRDCALFHPIFTAGTHPWMAATPMHPERGRNTGGGRWYPTLVTLPNGQVLMMGGLPARTDGRQINTMLELFDPVAGPQGRWIDAGDQFSATFAYPRMHLLPDGQVVCVTSMEYQTQKWDPATGAWTSVAAAPGAGYDAIPNQPDPAEISWTSVLLPLMPPDYRTRVLLAGKEVARLLDLGERGASTDAAWQNTAPRTLPAVPGRHAANAVRVNINAILLPDGTILFVGGTPDGVDEHGVLAAELYDPAADRWTTLSSMTIPRNYHSVALLLPDGRVWTAGSNFNAGHGLENRELRMEVYSPPYLSSGPRPAIETAPESLRLPTTFAIRTPQAHAIRSAALIRTSSVTHAFNADQRYVGLAIEGRSTGQLTVASPPDTRVAPPGHYLLFIIDQNGVPSVGRFVRVMEG